MKRLWRDLPLYARVAAVVVAVCAVILLAVR